MDRAASAGFEGIAQMLLEQKKLMDALESENRELRRQIADLRRGIGIAVVIEGKTIQLASEPGSQQQPGLQSLQSMNSSAVMPPSTPNTSYSSPNNGRSNSGQGNVNLNGGDKRENTNARSPLADSFVL